MDKKSKCNQRIGLSSEALSTEEAVFERRVSGHFPVAGGSAGRAFLVVAISKSNVVYRISHTNNNETCGRTLRLSSTTPAASAAGNQKNSEAEESWT